jgi:hypothetical protein
MDGRVMMMIGGTLQQQMGSTVVLMMMMVGNGTDVKEVKRDSCCSPRSLDHFHLLFQNKRLLSLISRLGLPEFYLPAWLFSSFHMRPRWCFRGEHSRFCYEWMDFSNKFLLCGSICVLLNY